MKILDWLAKLGILRMGTKAGTYRSGTDRPAEFMMDGVYDAERDLTTKDDIKELAGQKKAKKADKASS